MGDRSESDPLEIAVAAIWRVGGASDRPRVEVLVARRKADAIRGGLWELPGGKIEPGESADAAARRETLEETGVTLSTTTALCVVEPDPVTRGGPRQRPVRIHAVLSRVDRTIEAKPLGSAECRWIGLDEFDQYAWPPANAPLNDQLQRALESEEAALRQRTA